MIVLTRLDGSRLALNSDQVERLDEATRHTVVTLVNGSTYIVAESMDAVVELVTEFRARVATSSQRPVRRRMRTVDGRRHLTVAGDGIDHNPGENGSTEPSRSEGI